jgi:hypothetical protein
MKRFFVPAATALILAGAFFLPAVVTGVKDRQMIDEYTLVGGSSFSIETKNELGIIDRLKMMMNVDSIQLENGKNLDADSAFETALSELERFNAENVMALDYYHCELLKASVSFYVDSVEPTKNMITWLLDMDDQSGHSVMVTIDVETGVILPLNYISYNAVPSPAISRKEYTDKPSELGVPDEDLFVDPDVLTNSIAAYYDLEVLLMQTEKDRMVNGYELLLRDGGDSVILLAMITRDGFWTSL